MVFDRRGSNPLGVVRSVGYWRNWKRASLARTRYWDRNPDTPYNAFRSHGLVGYDARLTRERSRVRSSVRILFAFLGLKLHTGRWCGSLPRSHLPVSLVGQDTRFSPWRPGFESRTGSALFFFPIGCILCSRARARVSLHTPQGRPQSTSMRAHCSLACPSG